MSAGRHLPTWNILIAKTILCYQWNKEHSNGTPYPFSLACPEVSQIRFLVSNADIFVFTTWGRLSKFFFFLSLVSFKLPLQLRTRTICNLILLPLFSPFAESLVDSDDESFYAGMSQIDCHGQIYSLRNRKLEGGCSSFSDLALLSKRLKNWCKSSNTWRTQIERSQHSTGHDTYV